MVSLSLGIAEDEAREKVIGAVKSGAALAKFREWIIAQGGRADQALDPDSLPEAETKVELRAKRGGYITSMNAEAIGIASVTLGAGREKKEDKIDFSAGIVLCHKLGDKIEKGDVLAVLHTAKGRSTEKAEEMLTEAIKITDDEAILPPLIYGVIK